jgi:hypothetical protein
LCESLQIGANLKLEQDQQNSSKGVGVLKPKQPAWP